jgi:hypothetical protein
MIKTVLEERLGVHEDEFQDMVDQGYIRLANPETGEQFPVSHAPLIEWPANLLLWSMSGELPEGDTLASGSPCGAFAWGVAVLLVLARRAM